MLRYRLEVANLALTSCSSLQDLALESAYVTRRCPKAAVEYCQGHVSDLEQIPKAALTCGTGMMPR